jgi:hypothetical protein
MESTIATRESRSGRSKRTHPIRPVQWVQWVAAVLVLFGLAAAGLFIVSKATTEYLYWSRILAWKDARFDDFATKFPARSIANGSAIFYFRSPAEALPSYLSTVSYRQDGREVVKPLSDFLSSTGTTAFVVLKGDQLLYEGYFNGANRTSTQTSFSVAKSFGSALIGIAIDEGYIASIEDPITRYLPELAGRPGLDEIRIRDLLTMSSGLRYMGKRSLSSRIEVAET